MSICVQKPAIGPTLTVVCGRSRLLSWSACMRFRTSSPAGLSASMCFSSYPVPDLQHLVPVAGGRWCCFKFYARRIRRIFPALFLVLAAALVLGWFTLLADEYSQLGKHVAAASAFVLNFVLRVEAGYFDTAAELKPLLHLWSLAIEEQFYLLWPAFLVLAFRFRRAVQVQSSCWRSRRFTWCVAGLCRSRLGILFST